MASVVVRDITLGEGAPKICVPIVATTEDEIIAQAKSFEGLTFDLVEWRVDWFDGALSFDRVQDVLIGLRESLGNTPLLFTFRTKQEGGEKEISPEEYCNLNAVVCASGYVDLIDVELFMGDDIVRSLVCAAHEEGVKVVASNHDFVATPEKEELLARLRKMRELGADIPKIAVMPQSSADVLTLLCATEEMSRTADCPIITMSMSNKGVISRVCGEFFGSALTFGSAAKASAPGQMNVGDLKTVLNLLHESL